MYTVATFTSATGANGYSAGDGAARPGPVVAIAGIAMAFRSMGAIASLSHSSAKARHRRRVARGDQCLRREEAPATSACRTIRLRCPHRSANNPRFACSRTKAPATVLPAVTIDGTDPEAIAAASRGGRAGARRPGPTLIELVAMRMCGHAHHDDMLYSDRDCTAVGSYPPLTKRLRGS